MRFIQFATTLQLGLATLLVAQGAEPTVSPAVTTPLFVSVVAGSAHFCGVTSEGDIYCWGDNQWGQLGTGSTLSSPTAPVRIASNQRFRQVAAGSVNTCALTTDGYPYCWGSDASGSMGDATTRDRCVGAPCATEPMPVAIGHRFDSLTVGFEHACGIERGRAFCWGRADVGQLGAVAKAKCESIECSRTPLLVDDTLTFSAVSSRGMHTCGLASAGLFCWGDSRSLGGGVADSVTMSRRPVRVAGTFAQVSTGGPYSCATETTGSVRCWGSNVGARLGSDNIRAHDATITAPAGERFVKVTVGGTHTCALTATGVAYCWGLATDGRLGGATEWSCSGSACSPYPVRVELKEKLIDLAASGASSCAITAAGSIYCWGSITRTTVAAAVHVR
jgi:alpha-tubulin suppressor-like RCC1 family protein